MKPIPLSLSYSFRLSRAVSYRRVVASRVIFTGPMSVYLGLLGIFHIIISLLGSLLTAMSVLGGTFPFDDLICSLLDKYRLMVIRTANINESGYVGRLF